MSTVHDLQTPALPVESTPAKFPAAPYARAGWFFGGYVEETARAASSIVPRSLRVVAARRRIMRPVVNNPRAGMKRKSLRGVSRRSSSRRTAGVISND